jgi:hypothetical protein
MAIMTNGGRIHGKTQEGIGAATGGQFDKFAQHATPQYAVGFKIETADGKAYRYAQFDTTVNRGVLVAQDFSQVSVADKDNAIIAPASATSVSFEPMKPGALGSTVIQATIASVTANQFAGATITMTDDLGEGYTYSIKGNTATDSPVTGDVYIFLNEKIQVAVDNTTDFSIVANRWNNLEIATAATDGLVAGVSCVNVAAATPYAWVQTKGACGVLQDATAPVLGAPVQLSSATSGAVTAAQTAGTVGSLLLTSIVGICLDPGDSTGASMIDLRLE